jgi:hypothetical protein
VMMSEREKGVLCTVHHRLLITHNHGSSLQQTPDVHNCCCSRGGELRGE